MSRYRQHYTPERVDRRRSAAVDFLAVVTCALLFALPWVLYFGGMKP